MLWVFHLPGELRPGWLVVVLQSQESLLTVYHSIKTTGIGEKYPDNDITCVFSWCVEVLLPMALRRPPCLSVCTSSLSHTRLQYRLPTEVLCFDREGEGGGRWGQFFFWLWKMEASFMTHVPCPPVKITPAVFQRCSIIGCTANENNGACGEETRQTKRKKGLLDGNTCSSTLYIYIILSLPIRLRGRPLTYSHTCRNL